MTTQEITLQQMAHEIYAKWQGEGNLRNWKQDPRYAKNNITNQHKLHDIINNFIRQDYF